MRQTIQINNVVQYCGPVDALLEEEEYMVALSGKVAIVTGGGTGIGRAAAERFAQEGAHVVVCGRREDPLQSIAAHETGRISYVCGDVANDEHRTEILNTTLLRHGRLDILVNNAAASTTAPFADQTKQDMERMVSVNLTAPMLFIHEALPHLIDSKGCIINVSSAGARYQGMPPANITPYGAAKAGMNQLTRNLATELGPHGVRVNAVAPGLTDTEMAAEATSVPEMVEALKAITPLGRIGLPDDVARVIFFLASSEADWVTGQIVDATGGFWLSQ